MLWVFRSNRIERLISAQIDLISRPLGGPLEMEWVGVGSAGMRRRLLQDTAREMGISAGIRFAAPEEIFDTICRPSPADLSPFHPQVLTWAVYEQLPMLLQSPAFEPLRRYLPDTAPDTKRLGLSRRIARVFSTYTHYRPETVLAWEGASDDEGDWQPQLFRTLTAAYGADHAARNGARFIESPAEQLRRLPFRRLSFFGISAFSPLYVSVLSTLAHHMDVYLFVLSPSVEWWADDHGGEGMSHPLGAALGRCGRDFQWVLEEYANYLEPVGDLHEDPATEPGAGLLQMLQSDLLNLRTPKGRDPSRFVDDMSLQVHECPSPLRELEIVKDRLLALFERFGAELSPDDVAVTAPNLAVYEPYIAAVFGGKENPIPYHLASRTFGAPTIHGFLRLLACADGRLTVRDVFDVLATEPVLRRFGLSAEDAVTLESWVGDAGVRWGADRDHRVREDQPAFEENTWRFGIDRLLLGLALSPDTGARFDGRSPSRTMDTGERVLLERFLQFLDALSAFTAQSRSSRTPERWRQIFVEALESLFDRGSTSESEQQLIGNTLSQWVKNCRVAKMSASLSFSAARRFLSERLARLTVSNTLRPNGMTVAEPAALRGVPFRVICALGFNEADFPRREESVGFDRMAAAPKRGDRSVTEDDRYLFLELLLSARDAAVVSYVGRDPRTGIETAPSSVVSEVVSAVEKGFGIPASKIVLRHPASPYARENFFDEREPRRFSYASSAVGGALPSASGREVPCFFDAPLLPIAADDPVDPQSLIAFFTAPARELLRLRLGVAFSWEEHPAESREPIASSRDDRAVVDFLLERAVAGERPETLEADARAAGLLPFGEAGAVRFRRLSNQVAPFARALDEMAPGRPLSPISVDFSVPIDGGGIRTAGEIFGVYESGLTAFSLSKRKTVREMISLYLSALVCGAAGTLPEPVRLLAYEDGKIARFRFIPPDDPAAVLAPWVACYLDGMRFPLPLLPDLSYGYAKDILAGKSESVALRRAAKQLQAAVPAYRAAELTAFRGRDPLAGEFGRLAPALFGPLISSFEKEGR